MKAYETRTPTAKDGEIVCEDLFFWSFITVQRVPRNVKSQDRLQSLSTPLPDYLIATYQVMLQKLLSFLNLQLKILPATLESNPSLMLVDSISCAILLQKSIQ